MKGYQDKTFRPNAPITREEVAAILSRIDKDYKEGKITKETALEYSLEKTEMDQMIRGMYRDNSLEDSSIL